MANVFGKLFGEEEDEVMGAPEASGAVEQPLPVGIENPMVREYMMNRKSLVDKQKQESAGPDYSGAALSILDGITGRSDADEFSKERKEKKANELKQLDEGFNTFNAANKADYELQKMGKDKEIFARESDPMSEESKLAQNLAKRMGVSPEMASKITAEQWKAQGPMYQKMFEVERTKEDRAFAREDRALAREDRLAARSEGATARAFANLPEEKKQTIIGLAKKNVDKQAIANSIDSVMNSWDKLSEDEKLTQGKQLIKVLNSTQGSDAVGVEEARRLAGKLQFAMGNLTNDNPVQFGRDLEGFKADAQNTSKFIKDSVASNNAIIDEAYGRPSAKSSTQPELPPEEASAARQKRIAELKAKKAGTYVSK
jgi:hypothetical protein